MSVALFIVTYQYLVVGTVIPPKAAIAIGVKEDTETTVATPHHDIDKSPRNRLAVRIDNAAHIAARSAKDDFRLRHGRADLHSPIGRRCPFASATRTTHPPLLAPFGNGPPSRSTR